MKKKLFVSICFILAAMLIFNMKLQVVHALTSGDYEYALIGNDAVITRYIGEGGNITIPATIDGYNVTSIGENAFYYCDKITSITIGNNVKSIGNSSFQNCSNLTSVIIENSVTSIGNMAFAYCNYLNELTMGNNVTSIGDGGFYYCISLGSVNIPNSVVSIGNGAFDGCSVITNITIGNQVKTIGDWAFSNCESLTTVILPDSLTSIGKYGFAYCFNLSSINIPANVAAIGDHGFYECSKLKSIAIPNNVKSIENYTFHSCTSLSTVSIGDNVTSIGTEAFSECSSLTNLVIPSNVTNIGMMAFYHCDGLTNVTLGDKVTNIDVEAFYYCINLSSIVIPISVSNIGNMAFSNCTTLDSAIFLGRAPIMGTSVFKECASSFKVYYYYKFEEFSNSTPWSSYTTVPFYIANYNGNDNTSGSVPTDDNLYFEETQVTVLGNTGSLSKSGYTFGGWNTKADGTGITYQPGAQFTIGAGNDTLYAKWNPISALNVNISAINGSVSGLLNPYKYGDNVSLAAIPQEGYIFLKWTDKFGNVLSTNENYNFTITDNVELNAIFTDKCDVDKSGEVNILDLAALGTSYNSSINDTNWNSKLDFNKDNIIDIFDLVLCSKKIK